MSAERMVGAKTLEQYPILHRFLTELYRRCDIYETDNILELIQDDYVVEYCRCGEESCSTVYLLCNRLPQFEDGEDEYVETYESDNGLIVLHFYDDGRIEVEALEYEHYPFKDELVKVYNQEEFNYALESDLEQQQRAQQLQEAQTSVDAYFLTERQKLATIVID